MSGPRSLGRAATWSKRTDGWGVVVHGGAGDIDGDRGPLHAAGCRSAAIAASRAVESGATAVEAAAIAVEALEDNPLYNAGTGAALDERGELSLDASIMCGATLDAGGVCNLPPFKHPIAVAKAMLLEGRRVLLAGEGAAEWAERHGFARVDAAAMTTDAARARLEAVRRGVVEPNWAGGTVGCVVRDREGRLAAATSTGGVVGKPRGRIGDSPIIGAGTYADDAAGAVSNTGDGEAFLRFVAAKTAIEHMRSGASCVEGISMVLESMGRTLDGYGGTIAIDALGFVGWARTTMNMSWAAFGEGWNEPQSGF